MSPERVAPVLRCTECEAHWLPADEERWRAYHGGDDLDEPAEVFFYCRACAEREFGERQPLTLTSSRSETTTGKRFNRCSG
jgi:hypothetical protein